MYTLAIRRRAAQALGFACAAVAAAAMAAATDGSDAALDLPQVERLAAERQPMLEALDADARAARASAIADRQLPDPQLVGGVRGLPVEGPDAYSFTRDTDTQIVAGLMQTFPGAGKRRLRGQRGDQEALRLDASRALALRAIERDAGLAWLALWQRARAAELLDASLREAQLQREAVDIAVRTDRAPQADLFAAQVEVALLHDRIAENAQVAERARASLSRWIGDAAERRVAAAAPRFAAAAPRWPALPPLDTVIAGLRRHPQLQVFELRSAEARTGAELAKADYRPDWRIELGYGDRARYADMVMLQVGVDLPVFTAQRQDRRYAAALAVRDSAEASRDDSLRELAAETRADYRELQRLNERLEAYGAQILPPAQSRVDAALAAWRSGTGTLTEVLEARRAALDLQLNRLQLEEEAGALALRLRYLGAYDHQTANEGAVP